MGIPYVKCVSFGLKSQGLAMVLDQMQVKISLNKSLMLLLISLHPKVKNKTKF